MEAAIDFTMWGMFAHATIPVQLVMVLLVIASVWCWAVIVDKWVQYRKARTEARVFDEAFWSGNPLDELFDRIIEVARTGIPILMVEQNARQALEIADKGYVLVQGRNAFTGTGKELLNNPEVRKSFLGG